MLMTRSELLARITLFAIVAGLPLAVLGVERGLRPMAEPHRVITIEAWAPEAGGFSPPAVEVNVGETVTLRFRSMDVTHGIAIGPGLDAELEYVDPGEQGDITLTFDEIGTYTFYCTTWCSRDHWRMRGIIQVRDPNAPFAAPPAQTDPIIQRLVDEGVNIDAAHTGEHVPVIALPVTPSAQRGRDLAERALVLPPLDAADWRQRHAPQVAIPMLQASNPTLPEADLYHLAAYLWRLDARDEAPTARQYDLNCAACHGQSGHAEGPAAPFTAEQTTAFADSAYMFATRPDVLYAKIRRGGMGTDMPNFGTLFTPDETWALVDYLWRLAFETDVNE